ncbi:unnamed protein product [Microthlaspi erraticum]|uniref:Uncharacterized protein n=1 Tax=Microthlaspi erraticum TaxID=1685480 RepID=A0A6D2KU87_9BRAS|nr:unnamed protein product [Microthlaspi erraticum]
MVLTEAELLQLAADIKLLIETIAVSKKEWDDLQITKINGLFKMSHDCATVEDRKIMDELKAEEAHVVKVLQENEKLMTDLTGKLMKAIAEKEASLSKASSSK